MQSKIDITQRYRINIIVTKSLIQHRIKDKLEQEGNVRGFTYGEPGYGGAVDGLEQPHSYIL
jgi:hypothetical protein